MTFDESLATAAAHVLVAFGEDATYKPAGGSDRAITAVVDREQDGTVEGTATAPFLRVTVTNSATLGISAGEINEGNDELSLPARQGDTAQDRAIVRLISQDAGMLELEVR